MMKTLSIVVRSSNDAPALNRCLTALSKQTYPGELMEVIVADSAGRLQCQQLVRWWASSARNSPRAQAELRYLKVSRNATTALLDAARFACGAVLVVIDDTFEATSLWSLDGVAAAMEERRQERMHDPATALAHGHFVLRQEFLLGEGHTSPRPLTTSRAHVRQANGIRLSDASNVRFYGGLLLLLATITFAVIGETRLAILGAVAWSSLTFWLAFRLLQTNFGRAGGWRRLFHPTVGDDALDQRVVTANFSSKETRRGTQGI